MGDRTGIEWTDATWNPLRGCSRVSEGCRHCYAEHVAARFSGDPDNPLAPYFGVATRKGWTGHVALIEEHLADPLRWRKPRRVFVNSMSDLFHEKVRDEWIDRIFAVMALAPQHAFQVLTKRPERMQAWASRGGRNLTSWAIVAERYGIRLPPRFVAQRGWPLPNVWLGVSVEDQATADERIPLLHQTPAAVRFVSYEPAIGPVDFAPFFGIDLSRLPDLEDDPQAAYMLGRAHAEGTGGGPLALDWLIVGGESGPGARPFDVAWARSTIAACRDAGVACFVKQLGSKPCDGFVLGAAPDPAHRIGEPCALVDEMVPNLIRLASRKGGDMAEWPDDLRVREFPESAAARDES